MYEGTAGCDTSQGNEPINKPNETVMSEALPTRQHIPLEFTAGTETPTLGQKKKKRE